jgi:hypothetical protein
VGFNRRKMEDSGKKGKEAAVKPVAKPTTRQKKAG